MSGELEYNINGDEEHYVFPYAKSFFVLLALFSISFASINVMLSDQGATLINRSSGLPLTGIHNITTQIWDSPAGGSVICNEWGQDQINNGSWNMMFGYNSSNPCLLDMNGVYYRTLIIDGETPTFTLQNGTNVARMPFMSPLGMLNWSYLQNFPASCGASAAITAILGTPSCAVFLQSEANASAMNITLNQAIVNLSGVNARTDSINATMLSINNSLNNTMGTKGQAGDCGLGFVMQASNANAAPTCVAAGAGAGTVTNIGIGIGLTSSAGTNITTTGTVNVDSATLNTWYANKTSFDSANASLNSTLNICISNQSNMNSTLNTAIVNASILNSTFRQANNSLNITSNELSTNSSAINISKGATGTCAAGQFVKNISYTTILCDVPAGGGTVSNIGIGQGLLLTGGGTNITSTGTPYLDDSYLQKYNDSVAISGLNGTLNETIHNASSVNSSLQTLITRFNSANSSLNITVNELATNLSFTNSTFWSANNSLNNTLNICITNQSWINSSMTAINNTLNTFIGTNFSSMNNATIVHKNTTNGIENATINASNVTTTNGANYVCQFDSSSRLAPSATVKQIGAVLNNSGTFNTTDIQVINITATNMNFTTNNSFYITANTTAVWVGGSSMASRIVLHSNGTIEIIGVTTTSKFT